MWQKIFQGVVLSVGVAVFTTRFAAADAFTFLPPVSIAKGTSIQVQITTASPGQEYKISYVDAVTGKSTSTTVESHQVVGMGAIAIADIQAKNNTFIRVKSVSEPDQMLQIQTASLFTPGTNSVVSSFSISPGSSLTLAGNTFALTGGFASTGTSVDYNPASPNFGALGGFVHNFAIQAVGPGGTIHIAVSGSPTFTINLASLWAQTLPIGGLSVPLKLTFSGTLTFNSLSSPFNGTFDGKDTFFPNGSETVQGPFHLITAFGPANGTFSATTARSQITPEPSTLSFFGIGMVGLASYALRDRSGRKKKVRVI